MGANKPILIFLLLACSIQATAQAYTYLDINNVRAKITPGSDFFGMLSGSNNDTITFEYPKNSGHSLTYATGLWVTGYYNNQMTTSCTVYSNYPDFYSGPISNTYGTRNKMINKVWPVYFDSILYHVINYNIPGYNSMPKCVRDWPAHGDTTIGQAFYLAPFVDANHNKIYDPLNGDYPAFCGDQGAYVIFNNDSGGYATGSPQTRKLEIHGLFYAYKNKGNALDNTILLKLKVYNRGKYDFDSASVSFWNDFDIGCSDFTQCDVMRNMGIGFTGDSIAVCSGKVVYGYTTPVFGSIVLKGMPLYNDGVDNQFGVKKGMSVNGLGFNDGIIDNERWGMSYYTAYNRGFGVQGDPQVYSDFYKYARGIWRDGLKMRYGGNAHPSSGSTDTICRYMFPAGSDSQYHYGTGGISMPFWDEATAGNIGSDRRTIQSSGPGRIPANGSVELDFAFIAARDSSKHSITYNKNLLKEYADTVIALYRNNQLNCPGLMAGIEDVQDSPDIRIYPNPARKTVNVFTNDPGYMLELYNIRGEKVMTKQLRRGENTIRIDRLSSGVYISHIYDEKHTSVRKIIVQH